MEKTHEGGTNVCRRGFGGSRMSLKIKFFDSNSLKLTLNARQDGSLVHRFFVPQKWFQTSELYMMTKDIFDK